MIKSQSHMLRGCGRHATGFSILYLLVILFALLAVVAIAVDWGRVQLARAQLQDSADAAAYAGMTAIWEGPEQMRTRALAVALDNPCDGLPVELSSDEDVQIGRWDYLQRLFVVLEESEADDANAVRIIARRTAARENPIPMVFARIIGINAVSIEAPAIAAVVRPSNFSGMVGITELRVNGNPEVHSDIASNGQIELIGNTHIYGDAFYADSSQPPTVSSPRVDHTGANVLLDEPLFFPSVPSGPYIVQNNNDAVQQYLDNDRNFTVSSNFTMPGGIYYFNDFTMTGNRTLTITEPVTIYATGDVKITGTVANDGDARNFKLRVIGDGSVDIGGTSQFYADIYAPQSEVTVHGQGSNARFEGAIIGGSLTVSGTAAVYYDDSLPPVGSELTFVATLVR